MTIIGLGLSNISRRLSIPELELPFSSSARRRGNASFSLPSSFISSASQQHQCPIPNNTSSSSSYFWNRPSLTPLLDKGDENYNYQNYDDADEEKYDFFVQKKHHRRSSSSISTSSSSSFSISKLSNQSKTYLIGLIYLVLFGLILVTYIAQNGLETSLHAKETLSRIQYRLGVRTNMNHKIHEQQSTLAKTRKNKAAKRKMVWSDEMRFNTTLPKPFDGYRWTFLHANVMQNMDANSTSSEKLEMLTFIEAIPPKRQIGWWQLTLPYIPDVLSSAQCQFSNSEGDYTTSADMEWDFQRAPFQDKRARWALLISCDIPLGHLSSSSSSDGPSSLLTSLELTMTDQEKTKFNQPIKLLPTLIPEEIKKGSLGICVAPLYGPLNDKKMLEWRLHHLNLGVKVVHWYDRDGRGRTREWVKELKRLYKLDDTYTDAPCISPETCGTGLLEDRGVSGDQVLYYADCLARSRHTSPTEWLAMIDIDEFLFPSIDATSNNNTLSSFLSTQDASTAALTIERFMAPSDPLLSSESESSKSKPIHHNPPNLILDKIQTLRTPQEIDRHDNTKMIYRTSSLKLAWVHWEVAFRTDQPSHWKKKLDTLTQGLFIVHVSGKEGRGPFSVKYNVKEKMKEHVENVREGYRAMIGKLPWLAS